MSWRTNLLLAFLGLAMACGIAAFQHMPGYLDSDYYFAGGLQLVEGRGFNEPYLWNYLDDAKSIPHPSHTYWMPLASIVAAGGMWLTGNRTYEAARLGFIVLAFLVPVVTAALAYQFSHRRELALISGLLAVFSIYYVPFLPVTDNYGVYLVLGALFFLSMGWRSGFAYPVMGALAGLLTLARTDGVLWLVLVMAIILQRSLRSRRVSSSWESSEVEHTLDGPRTPASTVVQLLLAMTGFALIAGPWLWRTYSLYGTALAPGGDRLLWLKSYDETFVYPASQLTFSSWISQGWGPIAAARLAALRWNLLNAFAAQGGLFLSPFILLAIWTNRRDLRVQIGLLAWTALLLVMTLIFPFAGARGGFFHSGAALQSLWWTLAPLGLESAISAARKRNLFTAQAFTIFRAAFVGLALVLTALIVAIRVIPGWGEGEQTYVKVESFLQQSGIRPGEIVMVRNPPGYFMLTGRPAIVVPYGDATSMLAVAGRYQARYLIIESVGAAGPIRSVYDDLHSKHFEYLGELDGTRIFRIEP